MRNLTKTKMVNYERAHKLYCLVVGVKDTDEFINVPLLFEKVEQQLNTCERAVLNKKLDNDNLADIGEQLGLGKAVAAQALARALRKMRNYNFLNGIILTDIVQERDRLRHENIRLSARLKNISLQDKLKEAKSVNIPLSDIGLSTRVYNTLRRAGIATVNDIVKSPVDKILNIKNFSIISALELSEQLYKFGFGKLDLSDYLP